MKYTQLITLVALFGLIDVDAIKVLGKGGMDIDIDVDSEIDIDTLIAAGEDLEDDS